MYRSRLWYRNDAVWFYSLTSSLALDAARLQLGARTCSEQIFFYETNNNIQYSTTISSCSHYYAALSLPNYCLCYLPTINNYMFTTRLFILTSLSCFCLSRPSALVGKNERREGEGQKESEWHECASYRRRCSLDTWIMKEKAMKSQQEQQIN